MYWTKSDFPQIILAEQLWKLSETAYTNGSPWTQNQFLSDLEEEDSHYLLLMQAKQCIGFISYRMIFDEAEIFHVVISNTQQNKGYGKKMLEEVLRQLEEQKIVKVFLEVRVSNDARKLYEAIGFEEIHIRKNYYQHPKEDGLIMSLNVRK